MFVLKIKMLFSLKLSAAPGSYIMFRQLKEMYSRACQMTNGELYKANNVITSNVNNLVPVAPWKSY